MKLLYFLIQDKFPDADFKAGDNLNLHPEYPYHVHTGIWMYPINDTLTLDNARDVPTREYTLHPDAKLFHFRTVADYVRACALFPVFLKQEQERTCSYIEGFKYREGHMSKLMDAYSRFNTWKNEICRASGICESSVSSNTLKTPLKFMDDAGDVISLTFKSSKNGGVNFKESELLKITQYCNSNQKYSPKDSISLLKQICAYILMLIKVDKHILMMKSEDKIIGIDYNAMRSAGYDGIYIHLTALKEAREISVESNLYYLIDALLYWKDESVCVWNYCFTD